jgi:hypothetical protein
MHQRENLAYSSNENTVSLKVVRSQHAPTFKEKLMTIVMKLSKLESLLAKKH